MYGNKIRLIREMRGLTQLYIADRIGIAQNTYSKIENNQSKLNSKMLVKIAALLEVTPLDIISNQPAIINFSPSPIKSHHSTGSFENIINSQKDLYEKILKAKDDEIARLNGIINHLIEKRNK